MITLNMDTEYNTETLVSEVPRISSNRNLTGIVVVDQITFVIFLLFFLCVKKRRGVTEKAELKWFRSTHNMH